jgi:hypothetical protein
MKHARIILSWSFWSCAIATTELFVLKLPQNHSAQAQRLAPQPEVASMPMPTAATRQSLALAK